ncbi:MAG TPA: hypothetical protein VEI02_00905 [Planctomycetota bacterium]|nr:hypothetical protein [Planctomycetota bacterium]
MTRDVRIGTCLWLAIAVGGAAAQGDRRLKVYDIDDIAAPSSSGVAVPAVTPLAAALALNYGEAAEAEESLDIDVDRVMTIVQLVLGESAEISLERGKLWVNGGSSDHDAVAAALTALRDAFAERVFLRIGVFDAAPEKTILGAAEADALFASRTPRAVASASTRVDRPTEIRAGVDAAFVADYDVEVAQESEIADPLVRRLRLGLTASVTACSMPDGRFLVRAGGVYASPAQGSESAIPVGSRAVGDMQAAAVDFGAVCGSGVVENGGAVVLGADATGAAWVVQATRAKAPSERRGWKFAGFGALLRAPGRLLPAPLGGAHESSQNGKEVGATEIGPTPVDSDVLLSLLRRTAWPEDQPEGEDLEMVGPRLFARGGDAFLERIRSAAAAVASDLVRPASIEVRYGRLTPADAAKAVAASDASRLPGRLCVSARSGETFRITAGTERARVVDHDVEIAQKARIADPVTRPVFSGVSFEGSLSLGGDGVPAVAGRFSARQETSRTFHVRTEEVGPLQLAQVATTDLGGEVSLPKGGWRLFGSASDAEGVFVVMMRAAE